MASSSKTGDGSPYGERVEQRQAIQQGEQFIAELDSGITITWTPDGTGEFLTPNTVLPEHDQLDVENILIRPIEDHEQEIKTALYPTDDLVEYLITFPIDTGLPPLYLMFNKPSGDHEYITPPKANPPLPAFPDAKWAKSKTKNAAGARRRWKDKKRIYEWDYQHGKVEVYDNNGNHLGEFDHITGEQTKPKNPNRKVEK